MPSSKISELAEESELSPEDLFVVVVDTEGTPVTKKVPLSVLDEHYQAIGNGTYLQVEDGPRKLWISDTEPVGAADGDIWIPASGDELAALQPLSATLTLLAALSTTAFGRSLLEAGDASALRTLAALGTIATQAASGVAITGGTIAGITDLAVADGGTGASTAAAARTNLGLVIGTDVIGTSDPLFALGLGPITSDPIVGGNATINANRAVYMRVLGSGTISKIGCNIGVQSGNVCVGVYANSGAGRNAVPGARQQTSGSVACPAPGYAEISLGGSIAVNHGDWLALVFDNATATVFSANGQLLASNLWKGRSAYQDTAFPLPATATPTAGLIKCPVLIGIA